LIIRKFREDDLNKASILAMETFLRFNGNDYFEESAIQKVIDLWNYKKNLNLLDDMKRTNIYFVSIESDGSMVGLIRGTSNRINSLFVKGEYHSRGIGKILMQQFENEAQKKGSRVIELKSSLFAVSFYERMGYKKQSSMIEFEGLKVYPMSKKL
jgi:ribosomal protein S18 acetylase RimI-like enzyme